MFYDLPFYAGLTQPVIVASDWADPELPQRDNWRKELYDAARFDPATGRQVLRPLDRVAELACHPQAVWFFVRPGNEQPLSAVPDIAQIYADRDVLLMRSPPKAC